MIRVLPLPGRTEEHIFFSALCTLQTAVTAPATAIFIKKIMPALTKTRTTRPRRRTLDVNGLMVL
jgi:hypothetical protein